jgi:hypothetical protein
VKGALGLVAAIAVAAAASALALTRPDPASQAQADGCQRTFSGLVSRQAPNWAYVNDKDYPANGPAPPPQWATGVVNSPLPALGSHPSPTDDPFVHTAYDVNFNVVPDAASSALVGGDPGANTGNFAGGVTSLGGETDLSEALGRLHIELEQTVYPTFAWPEPGNRVQVLGNWVWDCGHWENGGERTELHPFRALWIERPVSARSPYGEAEGDLLITSNATPAGASADCAHRTKGNGDAFKSCLASAANWQDPSGSYGFTLPAPPKPSPATKLKIRIVDQGSAGAPTVSVVKKGAGAHISLAVKASPNQRVVVAKQVFVGWTPVKASALPVHLRVSFLSLLVRRAMDPGCPNGVKQCGSVETTRGDQITQPPGEFNIYWDAAGIWSPWQPALFAANDGQVIPGRQTVDLYVPRNRPWRVLTTGRECDFGSVNIVPCPHTSEFGNATGDDEPGLAVASFRSPGAAVGVHRVNAGLVPSTCPAANKDGCYQVTFRVSIVDDAAKRAAARR